MNGPEEGFFRALAWALLLGALAVSAKCARGAAEEMSERAERGDLTLAP